MDSDKHECPVCGTILEDVNAVIDAQILKIKEEESKLIKTMVAKGYNHQPGDIDKYIKLLEELKTDSQLLNDFVISGCDSSLHSNLISLVQKKTTEELKLTSLETQKEEKYNQIKAKEHLFKNSFISNSI